jgi:hypothetical protein
MSVANGVVSADEGGTLRFKIAEGFNSKIRVFLPTQQLGP